MLNRAFEQVVDSGGIQPSGWRCLQFPNQNRRAKMSTDLLDCVPVMSATVLGLEMLLCESYVDLQMVSELILSDVGATIQVLRLAGREYENAAERPNRMGDCLASLDVDTWFSTISAHTFVCDQEHAATTAVWKHCRLIAQYAQLVAESIDRVRPEEAYLVGLLHEIESIPRLSGLPHGRPMAKGESALLGSEEVLPHFVASAIRSMNNTSVASVWSFILASAHELAGAWTDLRASAQHDLSSIGMNQY